MSEVDNSLRDRITRAVENLADGLDGCYGEKCWCSGSGALECKTGLSVEAIVNATMIAMNEPDIRTIRREDLEEVA